ncbi:MAG: DUF4913 domain-containing protein [Actinomycetota bacterium]|nr:DUF4913 domain-containing protein [Actinomycetota bacterium]
MTEPTGWADVDDEPTTGAVDEETPQLYYPSLPDFVEEFFLPMFRRDVTNIAGLTWCAHWWLHPEATYRLESLWRSWEHLRLDAALGSSAWLREHADHHLPILMSDAGPFKGCSITNGHQDRDYKLPAEPPPDGLYPDENVPN